MAASRRTAAALLLVGCALAGCATPVGEIQLAGGEGGEAWTFDKLVSAQVSGDGCDTIRFSAPRGEVTVPAMGGMAVARVPLQAGSNRVTADCLDDGRARASDSQQWDVRLAEGPKARVRTVPQNGGIRLDAGASELSEAGAAPLVAFDWLARPGNPAMLAGLPASGRQTTLPAPARDGDYFVTLRVTDAAGRSDESTAVFRVAGGRAEAVDLARDNPAWIEDAVVYGVAPFFFGERRLADVTARLDALAALGVNTLWLSPITAATEGDFGYAVIDFFRLRADFGDDADLRALIDGAHRRGLRVIMDFVPNHVSAEHRYYQDAEAKGADSPYFGFFERDAAGEASYYFDWPHLINLNFDHPEVQRWVIEGFAHWIREYDVDGFRADVAWGPRERAPEFWARCRAELKRLKPDLLLLAEAGARDPYYEANGFDAAYDWTDELGVWAWREAFEHEGQTAALLREAIAVSRARDRGDNRVFRFMNNNDTGARFIARYGLARTRLAAVLLLTLPGLPMIYTGQEVGAVFQPYDEGPVLVWEDHHGLKSWYRRLIRLRAAHPALHGDGLELPILNSSESVLAYRRPGPPSVLVLLNWSAVPQSVALPVQLQATTQSQFPLLDLLSGEHLNGSRPVTLSPYGARILAVGP